jgi:hypothetical protein
MQLSVTEGCAEIDMELKAQAGASSPQLTSPQNAGMGACKTCESFWKGPNKKRGQEKEQSS